jgi:flagellar protein FlaG
MTVNSVIDAVAACAKPAQSQLATPSARQVHADAGETSAPLIKERVENANKMTSRMNTTVRYRIHEASKLVTVKVMDKETGQVIREIPPQKFLDMMEELQEQVGFVINEKA